MKFEIITTSKAKKNSLIDCEKEFLKRINAYGNAQIFEIDHKQRKRPIDEIKETEGQLLLNRVNKSSILIALDEEGDIMSSGELAQLFSNEFNQGKSSICFLIGGAFGLSEQVLNEAKHVISLSRLTFTGQFARLILVEQIYRALTIMHGHAYHKP